MNLSHVTFIFSKQNKKCVQITPTCLFGYIYIFSIFKMKNQVTSI